MAFSIRTLASIAQVNSAAWDALDHGTSPFQRHGFLRALEESDSVGEGTGWLPSYILVEEDDRLLGACAAFIKTDSYGEYIFDWAWARASAQFGTRYYPKLTIAAPFTPATGNRFLLAQGCDREQVLSLLARGMVEVVNEFELSSGHVLFCSDDEAQALSDIGLARRASFQYHWHNRNYGSFEEFLEQLKSRKRKQIRKERKRAREAVDSIEFVTAPDLGADDFAALDRFYRRTVHEHGGFDYLRPGFFEAVAKYLPESMLFARATRGSQVVAGALFFAGQDQRALYGRYWGCDIDAEFLHFEVAYYAAIERCIELGATLFEAGAQGQHKLVRGFEPALTHSLHFFREPRFDGAIRGFLREEARQVEAHMRELSQHGPYRQGDDSD